MGPFSPWTNQEVEWNVWVMYALIWEVIKIVGNITKNSNILASTKSMNGTV